MSQIPRHEIINSIIKIYKPNNPEYLEIGVWCGDTFKNVMTINKDGVDPGQYCDSPWVNYKMTSDEFFKQNTKKYDIIFIDGLHTAFQVTKDIINSLNVLNNEGFIILDDVYPHSEYEQGALNLNKSGSQTGDVWKAVYHYYNDIKAISQRLFFIPTTERGSFIFQVKNNCASNIILDPSIPTCNVDGWYVGSDAEWTKYTFKDNFSDYIEKMLSLPSSISL